MMDESREESKITHFLIMKGVHFDFRQIQQFPYTAHI